MNSSDKQFKDDLSKCNTLNEVLRVCDKYYNLDAPLGIASKIMVVQGVQKIIKMINAVKRTLPKNFKL